MQVYRKSLLCALTTTLLSTAITHATEYRVGGDIGRTIGSSGTFLDQYFTTSAQGIGDGVLYIGDNDDPVTLGEGSSEASIFGLRADAFARAYTSFEGGAPVVFTFYTATSARAIWSDFIVTGPAGPSTVPISVNVLVEGSNFTELGTVPNPSARVAASMQLGVLIGNVNYGGEYGQFITQSEGSVVNRNGLLFNFDGSDVINTPIFNVPVNTPFSVDLSLITTTSVRSNINESFFMRAESDFSNTVTFATSGPVFNLPTGYTLNSVDAGIVNNAYVATPEPSSMLLSALGVGVIFVYAFARRGSLGTPCPRGV